MYLYSFDRSNIAALANPNGPYYLENGRLNLEALQVAATKLFGEKNRYTVYNGTWLLYYLFTMPLEDAESIQCALHIWKHYNSSVNTETFSHMARLHEFGIDVGTRVQWLLNNVPFGRALPLTLLDMGLFAYRLKHPKYDVPISAYIPNYPFKDEDLARLNRSLYSSISVLEPQHLVRRLYTDGFVLLGQSLLQTYFRQIFSATVKQHFRVDDAMVRVWPLMREYNVSMVDTLTDIRKTTKSRFFLSDIMAWYNQTQNQDDESTVDARQQMAMAFEQEIDSLLQKKQAWTEKEYSLAQLSANFPTDHPLYTPTRTHIAQLCASDFRPNDHRTNIIPNTLLVLRAGPEAFQEFLQLIKKKASATDRYFQQLFSTNDTNQLLQIVRHPLFAEYIDIKKLFNHYYSWFSKPLNNDNAKDHNGLYRMWNDRHLDFETLKKKYYVQNMVQVYVSSYTEVITRIGDMNTAVFSGTSLRDQLSQELRADLWGLLGATIGVSLQGKMYRLPQQCFLSSFDDKYNFPIALRCLMLLDDTVLSPHRAEMLELLRNPSDVVIERLYTDIMNACFGQAWSNTDVAELMVRDDASLVQFFRMQYIQHQPDFAGTMDALDLGDII